MCIRDRLITMLVHAFAAIAYKGGLSALTDTDDTFTGYGALYGTLAMLSHVSFAAVSPLLFNSNYEVFSYMHWLVLPTFGLTVLHSNQTLLLCAPVVLAGVIPLYLWKPRQHHCTLRAAQIIGNGSVDAEVSVLELEVGPEFAFTPMSFVLVRIPTVSKFEWHPIAISSRPDGSTVMLHIKNMGRGSWSGNLVHQVLEANYLARQMGMSPESTLGDGIMIQGPIGGLANCSFQVYEVTDLVLVAGGIGMATISSLIGALLKTFRETPFKLGRIERVFIIWVSREPESLSWFSGLLTQLTNVNLFQIDLYLTKLGPRPCQACCTMGLYLIHI
eukprot:TRINITY_DN17436_c0_g1_i2.p1 TRINITY_DN17436_c0_g1~~TRINITY_DN17436_c0_g1_i2.p1  ORF type:complete len:331 (+),score=62.13 TRINITY_DN17436_c0_g1_i2:164-1156(+)